MPSRALVVDANILVRAVLGKRVRELIEAYAGDASFFVPEVAYAEAEEHLAALVIKRGGDPEKALARIVSMEGFTPFYCAQIVPKGCSFGICGCFGIVCFQ